MHAIVHPPKLFTSKSKFPITMASLSPKQTLLLLLIFISYNNFLLLCLITPCRATDTNGFAGSLCGPTQPPISTSKAANLNSVFSSLETNVNRTNYGYYRSHAGEGSDRIYGLVQCRGDVSPLDCGNCTRESFRLASEHCNGTETAAIWQKWCFLRYSKERFYGRWEPSRWTVSYGSSSEDPRVSPQGRAMMAGLAAGAPYGNVMFATFETDVGNDDKRYGGAQCSMDLGITGCRNCLNGLLGSFRMASEFQRTWDVYGIGCAMWYADYQFYFHNVSVRAPPTPSAAERAGPGPSAVLLGIATLTTAAAMPFL